MGTGYTRNDTGNNIADGNVINASDLDGEYNAIEAAFNASTGHTHDGTSAEGAPIEVAGPAQDLVITATEVRPKTDNTLDLGTTTLEFKDAFFDGTVKTDTLTVDENATVTGNLTVNGNTTLGNAATDTVTVTADVASDLIPSADGTYDLGASGSEWQDLYIDGTANIDSLVADTVDINAGSIDGVTLGTNSAVTSAVITTADINGGTIDDTTIGGSTPAAGSFTTITGSGDMSIDTDTLFVDVSENRVGIGTDSPAQTLHLAKAGQAIIEFEDTNNSSKGRITTGGTTGSFVIDADPDNTKSGTVITFDIDNTERMRIDSSGNLLVGTTDTPAARVAATSGGGAVFTPSAYSVLSRQSTVSSEAVLILNDTGVDGEILQFRKDGSTVGSIGTLSGDLTIGTGDTGLFFSDSTDAILPVNVSTNALRTDGLVSLGDASREFNNLFLSGGVYLGGTGAANHLQDYEEGTFTPVLADASTGGNTASILASGDYVKIGSQVTLQITCNNINTSGMTSGNEIFIRGLPFPNNAQNRMFGITEVDGITFDNYVYFRVAIDVANGQPCEITTGGQDTPLKISDIINSASDIRISITYFTDS